MASDYVTEGLKVEPIGREGRGVLYKEFYVDNFGKRLSLICKPPSNREKKIINNIIKSSRRACKFLL